MTGDRNNTLSGEFPPVVLKSALKEDADRDEVLLEKASYIASLIFQVPADHPSSNKIYSIPYFEAKSMKYL